MAKLNRILFTKVEAWLGPLNISGFHPEDLSGQTPAPLDDAILLSCSTLAWLFCHMYGVLLPPHLLHRPKTLFLLAVDGNA